MNKTVVVVARHGERMDYSMKDAGENWLATAAEPWNPPLTEIGKKQGKALGQHIQQLLSEKGLPPLGHVYSSPLRRCRETAAAAIQGLEEENKADGAEPDGRKVRVEPGLIESINESWYRSWSLPTSDGTWGFRERDPNTNQPIQQVNEGTLRREATQPIQDFLLRWKSPQANDAKLRTAMDDEYEPQSDITHPYAWGSWESRMDLQERMEKVISGVAEPGKTTLLVSHGGPVTFLFSHLTKKSWKEHGVSTYACFSIYEQDTTDTSKWNTVVVNENRHTEGLEK